MRLTRSLPSLLLVATATLIAYAASALEITTYYAPDSRIVPAASSLIQSGTSTINIAANDLVDPTIVGSLAAAATAGRTVTAVLNLSGGTARSIAAAQLATAGVTVYASTMRNVIANHLLTVQRRHRRRR